MSIAFSIPELSAVVDARGVEGSRTAPIRGLASLAEAGPDDLSFLGNPKYAAEVAASLAGAILVPADFAGSPAAGQVFLRVDKPSYALALVCSVLEARLWPKPPAGRHPSAVVAAGARADRGDLAGALGRIHAVLDPAQRERLAEIIEKVNDLFEGELTDQDKLVYVNNVIKGKLLEACRYVGAIAA